MQVSSSTFLASENPQKLSSARSRIRVSGSSSAWFQSGATVPQLCAFEFQHFTEAEQEAIAEVLCYADALVESLEQLLAKKRQIRKGAMQELLTGKKRLPGFSGEWEGATRLGEILSIRCYRYQL